MSERPYYLPEPQPGPKWLWVLAILISILGFGVAPLFVRLLGEAGYAPEQIAFYRYAVTGAIALPFLGLRSRLIGATLIGLVAGAAMGVGWIGYVMAVEQTSIATAGVIYMAYPLFAVALTWWLLSRAPTWHGALAVVLVLGAGWLLFDAGLLEAFSLSGLGFVLLAPLAFGFVITALAGWMGPLSPMQKLAAIPLGATLGLIPVLFWKASGPIVPPQGDWGLILAASVVTSLVPSFLYVIAAPRLGPVKTAVTGSIELPVMVLVGSWAFAEALDQKVMLAGALVMGAVLISALSRNPGGRPTIM